MVMAAVLKNGRIICMWEPEDCLET